MVGPTYIFTAYRQSQLNCHARTIQPHESALRKRACHSTRYVALERSNRSRVPDRQDNRRHASARQSRRQPCAIRRLFCSNHLQSADAQVKRQCANQFQRALQALGIRTVMGYGHPHGCGMKSCVRRKCVKNVGDAHRAVIFLVGFAFAVIFEMSSGKGLVWGQSSNMDPSVTIPLTS